MKIEDMGEALQYWLGFHSKIGKDFMMNEDAFKYPIADYLTNAGNVNLQALVLERSHPVFTSKVVDIRIDNINAPAPANLFELKLAKAETAWQNERQRIFNDIIRLYFAQTVATGKCFFIIAGQTAYFQASFKKTPCSETNATPFYEKWFEFALNTPKTFDVATETDPDYQALYTNFATKYKTPLPAQITTTCEYLTPFYPKANSPFMTGIWSVS